MPRALKQSSCDTCRRRKVKCDEATPICGQCVKSNRYCRPSTTKFIQSNADKKTTPSQKYALAPPREALQDPVIARHFHNYLSIATWYDLCDASKHFSTIVPSLALDNELLFSAVIALSAMHACKTSTKAAGEVATAYHSRCVHLLIELDTSSPLLRNGVALAAACLLRSYEILDEDIDPNRHLVGAYSLASSANFLDSIEGPSLLAAGFWNYLREDITFSLFNRDTPLKLDLDSVAVPSFSTQHDPLHSISLILGNIINATFGKNTNKTKWIDLAHALAEWHEALSQDSCPLCRQTTSVEPLPEIWFLQDYHASAMHYFLVANSILCFHGREDSLHLLHDATNHSQDYMQRDLLNHYSLEICGIAFTTNIPAVLVNAYGPIAYTARFLTDASAQAEVIRRLTASKKAIGWPVERMISDLQRDWRGNQIGQV